MKFTKATRKASKLRIALEGPSGSGKTMTALRIAHELADGGTVGVIDTEEGSASLYAGEEMKDGAVLEFVALGLDSHSPQKYIDAIKVAADAGVDVLVIDSLSHAWSGKGGALEMVNNASKRSRSGNSYTAWRDVTPLQNAMVQAILTAPMHVICTLRVKTAIEMEKDSRGKMAPRKVGLKAIQREGLEYEFTIVATLDAEHWMVVTKSRCSAVADKVYHTDGPELARELKAWLSGGAPEVPPLDALKIACDENGVSEGALEGWLESKGKQSVSEMDALTLRKVAQYVAEHPEAFKAVPDAEE